MTAFFGVLGADATLEVVMRSLNALEYHGYDSAGIATPSRSEGMLTAVRHKGDLAGLARHVEGREIVGHAIIGHLGTIGPVANGGGDIQPKFNNGVTVARTGLVENFEDIRYELQLGGLKFDGESDAEVVAALIGAEIKRGTEPQLAVHSVLDRLVGDFAFLAIFDQEEDLIVAVSHGKPVVIGQRDGTFFLASDPINLVSISKRVTHMQFGDCAAVRLEGLSLINRHGVNVSRPLRELTLERGNGSDRPLVGPVGEHVAHSVDRNSAGIAMISVSLDSQLQDFTERVRGNNRLDASVRDEYVAFLTRIRLDLAKISNALRPSLDQGREVDELQAAGFISEYWRHLQEDAEKYISAENVAGLTLPLGIVASCTAIASLAGIPVAGTLIGMFITNQLKADKLVSGLTDALNSPNDGGGEQ